MPSSSLFQLVLRLLNDPTTAKGLAVAPRVLMIRLTNEPAVPSGPIRPGHKAALWITRPGQRRGADRDARNQALAITTARVLR